MKRVTKDNYENIVYVAYGMQTEISKLIEARELLRKLQVAYPTYLFISPLGFINNAMNNKEISDMALFLLDNCCDEMWYAPSEINKGIQTEIKYCEEFQIPYKPVDEVM